MGEYYENFNTKIVNGQSLVHLINLLFPNGLVGLEVGIFQAQTFCTFLQQCPKITTLYGVDNYKPSSEYVADYYSVDEKGAELSKLLAFHNVRYSGFKDKAVIYDMDSSEAISKFEDNSLDFIFLDSANTKEDYFQELNQWYPKLKVGGIFSGHDWDTVEVTQPAVNLFRQQNGLNNPMSTFDNVWIWIKNDN